MFGFRSKRHVRLSVNGRRRGCGEVGIPRRVRDFQAWWERLPADFSTARLLHSRLSIAAAPRPTFGRVAPHTMRPIAQAQRAIQMLMYRHGAAGQHRSPPYFMTSEKGFRLATSVGGVLTGRGADFVIIDDPLKPDEALSETQRKAVNEWFDHTLYSRLNDKQTGCIIIIMQRLHEDDLVGHVLEQEAWDLVRLPAIAEEDETHIIRSPYRTWVARRKIGEALHPEREPLPVLEHLRRTIGEYNF